MVPFNVHKEKLEKVLETVNSTAFQLPDFFSDENFKTLLEICSECNELHALRFFVTSQGKLICTPFGDIEANGVYKTLIDVTGGKEDFAQVRFGHRDYWWPEDFHELYALLSETDVWKIMEVCRMIAKRVLFRSPETLAIVCGSISSRHDTVEQNLSRFNRAVFKIGRKMPMFNQMPFRLIFQHVRKLIENNPSLIKEKSFSEFLIEHFYKAVLGLEKIWIANFVDGWNCSITAKKQQEILQARKEDSSWGLARHIDIVYLEEGYEKHLHPVW